MRALKKVAFDQGIFAPCFLGSFLTVLGVTQGNSPQKIKEEIKNNYVDIILTNWTVRRSLIVFIFHYSYLVSEAAFNVNLRL